MPRAVRSERWSVYMVRCKDGSLYSGIAKDLAARIAAHNAGKGAKYTKPRRPVTLVWSRRLPPTKARQREFALKQLTKSEKEALIVRSSASLSSHRTLGSTKPIRGFRVKPGMTEVKKKRGA